MLKVIDGKSYAQCGNCGEWAVINGWGTSLYRVVCRSCGANDMYLQEAYTRGEYAPIRYPGLVEAAANLRYSA